MANANRIAKENQIKNLSKEFATVQAAVLLTYSGLKVDKATGLRSDLRKSQVKLKVIKNTLASRAVMGTTLEPLKDSFQGPTVLAYTDADPVTLAKVLANFAKTEKSLVIHSGILGGKLLQKREVESLASIESREVLLTKLVSTLARPYSGLVYTLSGVLRKLVYALDAVRRKKEEEGK